AYGLGKEKKEVNKGDIQNADDAAKAVIRDAQALRDKWTNVTKKIEEKKTGNARLNFGVEERFNWALFYQSLNEAVPLPGYDPEKVKKEEDKIRQELAQKINDPEQLEKEVKKVVKDRRLKDLKMSEEAKYGLRDDTGKGEFDPEYHIRRKPGTGFWTK